MLLLVFELGQTLAVVRRHTMRATIHERRGRIPERLLNGWAHGCSIRLEREARVGLCLHERLLWVHARVHGRHRSYVG